MMYALTTETHDSGEEPSEQHTVVYHLELREGLVNFNADIPTFLIDSGYVDGGCRHVLMQFWRKPELLGTTLVPRSPDAVRYVGARILMSRTVSAIHSWRPNLQNPMYSIPRLANDLSITSNTHGLVFLLLVPISPNISRDMKLDRNQQTGKMQPSAKYSARSACIRNIEFQLPGRRIPATRKRRDWWDGTRRYLGWKALTVFSRSTYDIRSCDNGI